MIGANDIYSSSGDQQRRTYKGRMTVAAAEGVIFSAAAFAFPPAVAGAAVCFGFAAYNGLKLKRV